jgi:hypothetical protein
MQRRRRRNREIEIGKERGKRRQRKKRQDKTGINLWEKEKGRSSRNDRQDGDSRNVRFVHLLASAIGFMWRSA